MFALSACMLLASASVAQAQEAPEGDTDRFRYNSLRCLPGRDCIGAQRRLSQPRTSIRSVHTR